MTQLMMWKRDGVEECGVESVLGERWLWIGTEQVDKFYITELQPAKAVPIDVITISKELWKKLNYHVFKGNDVYDSAVRNEKEYWVTSILAENPHLVKPEPIKEPTNFAAVVEASYFEYTGQKTWGRFFLNGKNWILQGTLSSFQFRELINPVLISEGVVGEK